MILVVHGLIQARQLQAVSTRDGWDWAVILVGIAAGVTAILAFLSWMLTQRRRPEIEFLWRISTTGRVEDFVDWPQGHTPTVELNRRILVEASIRNVGDATGERSLANFVVPDCLALQRHPHDQTEVLESNNGISGLSPGNRVRFIARERAIYPSMWWQHIYALTLESAPEGVSGLRLLMEISDDRLNASGRRLLPSLVAIEEPEEMPYGTPWHAQRPFSRRPSRIAVGCRLDDVVVCSRGVRQSARDLLIAPSPKP